MGYTKIFQRYKVNEDEHSFPARLTSYRLWHIRAPPREWHCGRMESAMLVLLLEMSIW